MKRRLPVYILAAIAALVLAGVASAHAHISPPVGLANESQVYTLAVPTEKEDSQTTQVELTVPEGFGIDSFVPSPGWKRALQQTGEGENAVIQKVTWSGGSVPTGEDAAFSFLASPSSSKTYTFQVRQTYADGSVVDWSGPESSDAPAPTMEAVSSIGGGGSSTLAIIALVVGVIGVVLAGVALLSGGRRPLA
jgi:periplasmic copper chaperone A